MLKKLLIVFINLSLLSILNLFILTSCLHDKYYVPGNDHGSKPINEAEVNEYKRAVHRCYKMGGTRVVKIKGELKCY